MSENHREPEVPEEEVPVVECLDGLARITSKELAITHFVENGTLQNACSTRPRVVVGLGKSAHMHTVRLMNNRRKGSKGNRKLVLVRRVRRSRVPVAFLVQAPCGLSDWLSNVMSRYVDRRQGWSTVAVASERSPLLALYQCARGTAHSTGLIDWCTCGVSSSVVFCFCGSWY